MVFVTFPNGTDWFKANCVFRQLAEDVAMKFPGSHDVNSAMEQAQWYGHLALDDIEKPLGSRVIEAIRQVAEETVEELLDLIATCGRVGS